MSKFLNWWITNIASCKTCSCIHGRLWCSCGFIHGVVTVRSWWEREARVKYKQISNPFSCAFFFKIMGNSTLERVQVLETPLSENNVDFSQESYLGKNCFEETLVRDLRSKSHIVTSKLLNIHRNVYLQYSTSVYLSSPCQHLSKGLKELPVV